MRKPNSKAVRITALAAAAAFALLPMAPAAAAAAGTSSAFGVQVKVLNAITIGPTPTSTFPPGSNDATVPVDLGALGNLEAVYAHTSGNTNTPSSSASAGTANVNLLGTTVAGVTAYAIHANAVSATCTATGDTVSGSTTIANLAVGLNPVVNLTAATTQQVLVIPGVASVIIGEQITNPTDGSLTVNALHITLLNGNGADIIIGSVTCTPTPVAGVAAFSFQDLPLILGALALIVVIGFGIRTGIRRLGSAA
ncbi:MAG: choice-of-anchor P family protein [Jatrophihabitans sp.]|uniref:choice-of-anchor P family protein n=1 Tax=Jatrophihabitans sp. TaxID=1932789 RepID=UPI00391508BF